MVSEIHGLPIPQIKKGLRTIINTSKISTYVYILINPSSKSLISLSINYLTPL